MLILMHISLMSAAVLCLITGVGIAVLGRKKTSWLKGHKRFNLTGFCLLVTGALLAFANVVTSDGHHLAGLHQWAGLAALILAGITVFLGFHSFKAVNKPATRAAHRWTGRLALAAVLGALLLGLALIGLI